MIRIDDASTSAPVRRDVLRVWTDAFGPIEDEDVWTRETWDRHRSREGYRLATARVEGTVVGFAWGYTGQPGQYWSDRVADALPGIATEWIGGHFEFVELAVASSHRGRGIGGALHDALLAGLPHERALLGTSSRADDPAIGLYRSRGWQELGRLASGDLVMGRELDPA